MDDVQLIVNVLVGILSLKTILHWLGEFSEGHGVYFRLFLEVLLSELGVIINLFSQQNLVHILVNIGTHG